MFPFLLVLLLIGLPLDAEANKHPPCSDMQYEKKEVSFVVIWNQFKLNLKEEKYLGKNKESVCTRYFIVGEESKTVWQTWRKDPIRSYIYLPMRDGSYKVFVTHVVPEIIPRRVFIDTNNLEKSEVTVILEFTAEEPGAKVVSGL